MIDVIEMVYLLIISTDKLQNQNYYLVDTVSLCAISNQSLWPSLAFDIAPILDKKNSA